MRVQHTHTLPALKVNWPWAKRAIPAPTACLLLCSLENQLRTQIGPVGTLQALCPGNPAELLSSREATVTGIASKAPTPKEPPNESLMC